MGQSGNKPIFTFSAAQVVGWESRDCVDFAVALARLSGWLLHVDWWTTSEHPRPDQMQPLRVYVADNADRVFDVRGVRSISEFNRRIILDLARRSGASHKPGGVLTRFYSESKLAELPLRFQPDEEKIRIATDAIRSHPYYETAVPARVASRMPAHEAAGFSFGRCGPYAEAMRELEGLQPTALLAIRFAPMFEGTRRSDTGYFHSVVLHPDGSGEDSWGKAPLQDIAARFGVIEFKTNDDEHRRVMNKLRTNTPENFEKALEHAREIIRQYRQ